MKILVVDDVAINLAYVRRLVELCNHEVISAENGADALTALRSIPDIDAAMIDLNLPDMDGIHIFRQYRRMALEGKVRKNIPFLLITGSQDIERFKEAKIIGFADIILKPPTASRINDFLNALENKDQANTDLDPKYMVHELTLKIDETVKAILKVGDREAALEFSKSFKAALERIDILLS